MKNRLLNILIALDQFVYVLITLGYGSPDETMSSAAYRMEAKGRIAGRIFRPLFDWMFSRIEKDHCWKSFVSEKTRSHLPRNF